MTRAEAQRIASERMKAVSNKPPRRGTWDRDSLDYLAYRVRYLPQQLERARNRVAALENEARMLGFHDLVEA